MESHNEPGATTARRAVLSWQVLVGCATRRQTIHYGDLAASIGLKRVAVTLGPCLDLIANYCYGCGVPYLSNIVVNKRTGEPAKKLVRGVDKLREDVFKYRWHKLMPPTLDDLMSTIKYF